MKAILKTFFLITILIQGFAAFAQKDFPTKVENTTSSSLIQIDLKNKYFSYLTALDKEDQAQKVTPNQGEFLFLDFSSSNCGYCLIDIDKLAELNQLNHSNLEIISVWNDPDKKTWLNAAKKQKDKINWINLWDKSEEVFDAFDIHVFPTYVLIDPKGKILKTWKGKFNIKKVEKFL